MYLGREREIVSTGETIIPDPTKPGYSKLMMEKLNSRITKSSPGQLNPEHTQLDVRKAAAKLEGAKELDRLRFELAAIAGHFISPVWLEMLSKLKEKGADLGMTEGSNLYPLSQEQIFKVSRESDYPPNRVIQELLRQTENFFIDRCIGKIDRESKNPANIDEKETRFFLRWAHLLHRRTQLVLATPKDPSDRLKDQEKIAQDPAGHLKDTMRQASDIVWSLFRTLPEVYNKQYNVQVKGPELESLVRNTRPLVYNLATNNPIIGQSILGIVNKENIKTNPFDNPKNYDLSCFTFAEGINKQKYLELAPKVFEEIEQALELPEVQAMIASTTGCPALYVPGRDGRNVVSDFYDWNSDLYLKYCAKTIK